MVGKRAQCVRGSSPPDYLGDPTSVLIDLSPPRNANTGWQRWIAALPFLKHMENWVGGEYNAAFFH